MIVAATTLRRADRLARCQQQSPTTITYSYPLHHLLHEVSLARSKRQNFPLTPGPDGYRTYPCSCSGHLLVSSLHNARVSDNFSVVVSFSFLYTSNAECIRSNAQTSSKQKGKREAEHSKDKIDKKRQEEQVEAYGIPYHRVTYVVVSTTFYNQEQLAVLVRYTRRSGTNFVVVGTRLRR